MSRFDFVCHSLAILLVGWLILLNAATMNWPVVAIGFGVIALLMAVNMPRRA